MGFEYFITHNRRQFLLITTLYCNKLYIMIEAYHLHYGVGFHAKPLWRLTTKFF